MRLRSECERGKPLTKVDRIPQIANTSSTFCTVFRENTQMLVDPLNSSLQSFCKRRAWPSADLTRRHWADIRVPSYDFLPSSQTEFLASIARLRIIAQIAYSSISNFTCYSLPVEP
ncbi:Uncharacterized protein HZ326_7228 [Fusarium oxysporum f. sp. albedinis]|nr:Uncharacterized protein HZ326_7228 [Fusarium oxysporum f. sp. albedinis]